MHAGDVATGILIKLARVNSGRVSTFYGIALSASGHVVAATCRYHANTKSKGGYNDTIFHAGKY
jgi:hypothetical protein